MTLEEKLKAKSTEAMVYGKIVKSDTSITMQKQTVIKLTDAIAICQQEIAEACKERDRRFQIYANAINQIDDFFEYRYRNYGGERTKEFVMDVIGGIIKKLNAPKESE